jgi:hypothetical protein
MDTKRINPLTRTAQVVLLVSALTIVGLVVGTLLQNRRAANQRMAELEVELHATDNAAVAAHEESTEYSAYKAQLRQVIEEGWDWDYLSMRADYYIDEGLPIIAQLESAGDDAAVNAERHAVGRYQITPIMVRECNRILGEEKFRLKDRSDPVIANMMARIYLRHWLPRRFGDTYRPAHIAILWHGGSDPARWGAKTEDYTRRFEALWGDVHDDVE